MNVFFDTNVVLDVLVKREPFYADSAALWTLAERGSIRGQVSAVSFTNVYYIVRRLRNARVARKTLALLRDVFTPVACDAQVLDQALDSDFADFEDAVQFFSAVRGGAACIVTRNPRHFPGKPLPAITPAEFRAGLALE
ncbi:MAG: PIN domain-containing protein [Planctomycetes bacterium]|nr:PIN domain-containing protein [Planctomycetota bacterium]